MKIKFVILLLTALNFASLAQNLTEREKLAHQVLDHADFVNLIKLSTIKTLEQKMRFDPNLVDYKNVLEIFFVEILSTDEIKNKFAKIYAEIYTEKELKQLIVFYKSELGQKSIKESPVILQNAMIIGEEAVLANSAELERRIKARKQELLHEDVANTNFAEFEFIENEYSISVPDNWITDQEFVDGAAFQARTKSNNAANNFC